MPAYELSEVYADNKLLESADVNNISAVSLLFQTGYLTIRERFPSIAGTEYRLGYPNHEVEQSFQQYLLADYLHQQVGLLHSTLTGRLQKALRQLVAEFVLILNSVFASIPHTIHLPLKAYYHWLDYLILSLLGFKVSVRRGHCPWTHRRYLELPDRIYILEFKMSSAQIALDQIKGRAGYDRPYHAGGKPIVLIGIAFDKEKRTIGDWKCEPETLTNNP